MKYGYYDNEHLEYVITRPDTPTPWINYIGTGGFSGIISNTAGGIAFDGDPSKRRVTRYKFSNQPIDRPGRYLYIRDEDSGEFWSPTWQPTMREMQHYECRHGLGYTKITGTYRDIQTTITYLVPMGARYELWHVEMKNLSDKPRRLKLYSYVEFSFHDAQWDLIASWGNMSLMSSFEGNKIVVDTVAQQLSSDSLYDYISTDLPIDGYDCSLRDFIGAYRDESNPIVLCTDGKCRNTIMQSDSCVGVLSSSITLSAGESLCANYTLGATNDKSNIDAQIADAFAPDTFTRGMEGIRAYWQQHLHMLQVSTPDADINRMLNIWHSYQTRMTFNWSRFISIYERGTDRGFGFRDSMQDVLGVMHSIPADVKERIKLLLSIQRSDGNARAVYFPATGQSVGGNRSDDHLWSVFSVCNYVRETGDAGMMDEPVSFVDGGEASVLGHLLRGLHFTMEHLGTHGIPDMLESDWNDSVAPMNRGIGGAESTFVFFQLGHACYELMQLYCAYGRTDELAFLQETYEYCRGKLDTIWDGDWFIRAFTPKGERYGTKDDDYYKIYLNPQSWSVLSRLPSPEMQNKAMDSVMKYLYTDRGLTTLWPPISDYNWEKKHYFLFGAGARENGGIFFHSNTWAIIALAMLGRSEEAFRIYRNSLPTTRNEEADVFMTEPYVYSQTMFAPPHHRPGACVNSWLSGTASWMYFAATQWLLGIRPEYAGLTIDPHVPDDWDTYHVDRVCRGTTCHITVEKGETESLTVDGLPCNQNIVPWSMLQGKSDVQIKYIRV